LATAVENASVAQTVVPVFICPSGEDPLTMSIGRKYASVGILPTPLPEKDRYYAVRSDYDAMAGIQVLPDPPPPFPNSYSVDYVRWGVWGWAMFDTKTTTFPSRLLRYRPGKFSDVTDGLSNTIAIVERGGKPYDMLNGKRNVTDDNPKADYPGQVGWSVSISFFWSINEHGVGVNEWNSRGIYSVHPGGANVGIADGSVRFLSDSTDFQALVSLYGKADGGLPVRP
jgi:prepilin-type processing-associated H-X9-DG protein